MVSDDSTRSKVRANHINPTNLLLLLRKGLIVVPPKLSLFR